MRKISSLMKAVVFLLLIFSIPIFGQGQTVSGTVKDAEKNTPIAGVTIKVVGTTSAAQTNNDGVFTIKATKGQTLLISYIGFESLRKVIADGKLEIELKSSVTELEEVVVAMDIKRKSRDLGYSTQVVKGDDIKETQRENFIGGLQGRIAGATITSTSGVPGASSTIVLRGFNSLSLNNQPLFVIDGVVRDNSTIDATSSVPSAAGQNNTSNDFTNRISDVNPNDIESVTVLKGPEATVLYGSAASNGAIVITTKRAKLSDGKRFNVNYDNSFRFQSLQNMPKLFNGFAQGTNGIPSSSIFSSFGPALPEGTQLYDNVGNFFKTGLGMTHNLSVEFGKPNSSYRISGSYYDQSGVVPNTRLKRANFRITNNSKIGKYIDITPSVAYSNSNNDKALKGAGGYLLNLFLWPATDNAIDYLLPNGLKKYLANPSANNPADNAGLGTVSETDNPFFAVNRNESRDKTNNYEANLAINYNPLKWLTIAGRFGYNYYTTAGFQFRDPESSSQSSMANKGQLDNYWIKASTYNHTITATVKKAFGDFNTRFTTGTRWSQTDIQNYGISGTFDSTRSFDSSSTGLATRSRLSRATLVGADQWNMRKAYQIAGFGEATLSYKNLIFLTGSIAFESSSVLPAANRNYSYPGGSLSIIMSDIFPQLKGGVLSYWKLRSSLASTARLPDPYANQSNFVPTRTPVDPGIVPLQYAFTNANPDLKPERQKTYEIGTELRLLNDRVTIDAAYYNTKALDQIAQGFRASYGTGFILNTANNSSVQNEGLEVSIGIKAIRKKDFDWNIQFNLNHMWNQVLAIPTSIDISGGDYYDASTWLFSNARGGIRPGFSTGTITSFGYRRQDLFATGANGVTANNGAILVSALTGLPVQDAIWRVRANRTVWLTLGTVNRFRYKNWNLSFLWDLRLGGDIFNATNMYLTTLGKSLKTADRLTPRVVSAVIQNGLENTANPTVNNIYVTPYYNNTYYSSTSMPEEDYMEKDINAFRLRDISISYSIPTSVLAKRSRNMSNPDGLVDFLPIKSFSCFITCNDLLLFTNYSGADPSANGGNASLRGVGAVGFDYGNIAAPLSFNAGIRIGF